MQRGRQSQCRGVELEAIEGCEPGGGGIEKLRLASMGDTFTGSRRDGGEVVDLLGGCWGSSREDGEVGIEIRRGDKDVEKRIFLRTHT